VPVENTRPQWISCGWCGARVKNSGPCSCGKHCSEACHDADETKKPRHICSVCGKEFGAAIALTSHMRTHKDGDANAD
jgi:hypothetical protein